MTARKPEDSENPEPTERVGSSAPDALMTTPELMAYLSVSRTKLWQLVNNEGLPAIKLGGDYRYRKSKVDAWLERLEVKSNDTNAAGET